MGTPAHPFLSLFKGERVNSGYVYPRDVYSLDNCLSNEWISLDIYWNRKEAEVWNEPTYVSQNPILRTFLSNLLRLREKFIVNRLASIDAMMGNVSFAEYMLKNNSKRRKEIVVGNPEHEQQFQYYFNPYLNIKINNHTNSYYIDSIVLQPDSEFYFNTVDPDRSFELHLVFGMSKIITITFPRKYFDRNQLPPPSEIKYTFLKTGETIQNQTSRPASVPAPVARVLSSNTPEEHPLALTRSPSPAVIPAGLPPSTPPPVSNNIVLHHNKPPHSKLGNGPHPIPQSKNNGIELVSLGRNGKIARRGNEEPAPNIRNANLGGSRRTKKRKHRRSKTSAAKYRR